MRVRFVRRPSYIRVDQNDATRQRGMRRGERHRHERAESEPDEHRRSSIQVELDEKRSRVLDERFVVVRKRAIAVSVSAEVRGPHAVAAPSECDAEVAQTPAGLAEVVQEHHVHDVGVVGLAPDVVSQTRADGEGKELLRPRSQRAVPERLRFVHRRAPLGGGHARRASRERGGDGLAGRARLLAGGGPGQHAEAREAFRAEAGRVGGGRVGFARRSLEKRLELVRVHRGGARETTACVAEAREDWSGVRRRARASDGASSPSGDERSASRRTSAEKRGPKRMRDVTASRRFTYDTTEKKSVFYTS